MKIAVTGGKGGTGKSTVATALAVELGKNSKVLLADMDADCPNDHLLLNIEREKIKTVKQRIPKWNLDKCTKCGLCGTVCKTSSIVSIKGKHPLFFKQQCNGCGACVIRCPEKAISWDQKDIGWVFKGSKHGIDFLSGELKVTEAVSEFVVDAAKEELDKISKDYDYIIIDTAAGTHCDVISAVKEADDVLVVTEPTPLGLHDMELITELLEKLNLDYKLIINRADEGDINLIKKPIFAKIPYSKEIIESYSQGKPIEHESIKKIAEALI